MKRLLLAGAGHAHARVLRALMQQPMPGVKVVVISPEPLAPFSGSCRVSLDLRHANGYFWPRADAPVSASTPLCWR